MRDKIVLILAFILFGKTISFAQQEDITITAYYPSPYGVYSQLQAQTLGVGDTNTDGILTTADAPDPVVNPGNVWIAGNVGIGTQAPASKMDIRDLTSGGLQQIVLKVGSNNAGVFPNRVVNVGYEYGPAYDNGIISAYDYANNIYKNMGVAGSSVTFHTGATAPGAQPRMTVDISGNVGIGTVNPQAKLDVAGDMKLSGNLAVDGNSWGACYSVVACCNLQCADGYYVTGVNFGDQCGSGCSFPGSINCCKL